MKPIAVLTLWTVALAAVPVPKQPGQQCPSGYASESHWCTPMANAPPAVPKGSGQCPSSMTASGGFCIEKR